MLPPLSRSHAWAIALVATLTMTVSYIDRQTLSVLGITVTEALDISDAEYGLLHSAFALAYLVATPVCGWWIARIGPRRGLVISVLAWSSVAALHALVPGFGVLLGLRILLGITEGPSYPGSAQTVQSVLPPEDRPRGFGVLFSGSSIGGMIVPPLAAAIFAWWGWREAFLVTAIVGLAWVPLWIVLTSHPAVRARLDQRPSPKERQSLRSLLVDPVIHRALMGVFAAAPSIGMMLAWGAKYLGTTWHVPQQDVGRYLWLPPLLFDLGAIGFGDLAARIRRAPGAPPRLLFGIAAALAATLLALPLATSPWLAIAIIATSVCGSGGLYVLTVADAYARVAPSSVSMAGGLIACAQSIVFIVMNPLIGKAVDATGSYDGVALVIGGMTIPFAIIWIAWKPRR